MDRSGPIWPPDELLGEDPGDGLLLTVPSAGDMHTPLREPIAPVWLDANDPRPSGALAGNPLAGGLGEAGGAGLDVDDIRLTAEDWLGEAATPGNSRAGLHHGGAVVEGSVVEGSVVEGSVVERSVLDGSIRDSPRGATPAADAFSEGSGLSQPVPGAHSPWADPPRSARERARPADPEPVVDSVVEPTGPAPGVYDVPPEWMTGGPVESHGSILMRQITVVSRNANAGRAVARLLTITLQHEDDDSWTRAAGKIRAESDFAHAGDLLARDQALTVIDAGPDVRAMSWERAVDAADHLVVAVNAAGSGPAEAAALLDGLAKSKHADLARHAVTVVLMPVSRWGVTRGHEDVAAIRAHFTQRSHAVYLAPFDLRPTAASRNVWREIAETVRSELPEI